MRFSVTATKQAKPTESSMREYDAWLLTIMHYENDVYKSNIQMEFDSEIKMRDYVQSIYELDRKWTRTLGENEFWHVDRKKKMTHTHVLLLQKMKKTEKITKVLEEDNMLF